MKALVGKKGEQVGLPLLVRASPFPAVVGLGKVVLLDSVLSLDMKGDSQCFLVGVVVKGEPYASREYRYTPALEVLDEIPFSSATCRRVAQSLRPSRYPSSSSPVLYSTVFAVGDRGHLSDTPNHGMVRGKPEIQRI